MEKQELSGPWFNDAVIYHIYSLSLSKLPSEQTAPFINDYSELRDTAAEIVKWIPHIKGMGFNAVLFSPVFKSRSHGYDVTDYYEIDNRIGTNGGFQALVKQFHDNGIRVILDCVFNHCGRDFFAFRELQNHNLQFTDWFSGVDLNRQSPMGDYFTYDTWNGHYKLPKFNLGNSAVKEYLLNALRFWIDTFDIDGMRLDAADVLDNNFMVELRHVSEEKKNNFWLMGEVVHGDYSNWVNERCLHSVTNYILYKSLYSSHNDNNLYELAYSIDNSVPDNGLPLYTFLDNHDQSRIASSVSNPAHLFTLYALLFTLPGIPSVYYGSEWGVRGVKEEGSDHSLRPYINIDNRFEYSTSLTEFICKLIYIRHREKALKYGSYRKIYLDYNRPFVYERFYENERIIIIVNIANHEDTVNLNMQNNSNFSDLLQDENFISCGSIYMKPFSVRILKEL
ncbi:MAG: alpha-amylase family glycosyl hydrolase [Treponema sp.]|nr:alpha-amylase family glycosyl hydrolase [Treponema sp.]